MCIIMHHQPGVCVPEEHLDNSAINHPHGCGIAYIKDERVVIDKEMDVVKFKKLYHKILKKYPDSPIILHYRKMTDGDINLDNCHPFRIDKHHVFVHNGTIYPCKPDKTDVSGKNDTRYFNELVLRKLPAGWFGNPAIAMMFNDFISNSKLAFMRDDGKVWIIGEEKGTQEKKAGWDNKVWYSNQSYKEVIKEVRRPFGGDDYYYWGGGVKDDILAEWKEDGLQIRYNQRLAVEQAWDAGSSRWREYNTTYGRFEDYPYTCIGHIPEEKKPYRAAWDNLHGKKKDTKENKVLELPSPKENKRCDYCRTQFHLDDLITVQVDQWQLMTLCDDCLQFVEETGADVQVVEDQEQSTMVAH